MPACRLLELTPRCRWFTPDDRTDRPSLVAVSGSEATALLDVGASPAHTRAFLDALAPLGLPPLRVAVLTHWHWDHSFGASALDVPVVGHRLTAAGLAVQAGYGWSDAELDARVEAGDEIAFVRDHLRVELPDRSDLRIVLPQIVFDDRLELDLGDATVVVEHVGGDHAADSCVMHVVEDGLLVLGDALYQRLYAPVEHLTVERLVPLVERIRLFEARLAIEGHGDEPLDAAALGTWLDGLEDAAERVRHHGAAALETARDDDDRETLALLVAGLADG